MSMPTTLAAVLFAEVADFADLQSADERRSMAVLEAYRNAVDPVIIEHDGETVDITGTELLVVFGSAVSAVQCGLHLAKAARAAAGGPAGAFRARVGIHLGEIWRDSGKVYGNGVNVAARVMQAAPAGALLVSEDVYRQVATKLDLETREQPGLLLKNISRPLALYEVDWGEGFAGGFPGLEAVGEPEGLTGDAGSDHAIVATLPAALPHRPLTDPVTAPASLGAPPAPPEPPAAPGDGEGIDGFDEETFLYDPETVRRRVAAKKVGKELAKSLRDEILAAVDLDKLPARSMPAKVRKAVRAVAGETATARNGGVGIVITDGGIRLSTGVRPAHDHEATVTKARKGISSAVQKMVFSVAAGAGLGYGFVQSGNEWFIIGAGLLGLLPFLSGLGTLIKSSMDIRRARRLEDGRRRR